MDDAIWSSAGAVGITAGLSGAAVGVLGGRIEAGKDRRKVSRSVEIMGSISIGCTADADREW